MKGIDGRPVKSIPARKIWENMSKREKEVKLDTEKQSSFFVRWVKL
jgi:hypothetical protein